MVDSRTGRGAFKISDGLGEEKFRFRKGAKLKATNRNLNYSKQKHPQVTSKWFETAKQKHGDEWINLAKDIAGGGKK